MRADADAEPRVHRLAEDAAVVALEPAAHRDRDALTGGVLERPRVLGLGSTEPEAVVTCEVCRALWEAARRDVARGRAQGPPHRGYPPSDEAGAIGDVADDH